MRRTIERCASKSNDQTIGVGNGTGFSNTALTTVKIAVFVPMPSVSAATAAIVKPGLRLNNRSECATSLKKVSILCEEFSHNVEIFVISREVAS